MRRAIPGAVARAGAQRGSVRPVGSPRPAFMHAALAPATHRNSSHLRHSRRRRVRRCASHTVSGSRDVRDRRSSPPRGGPLPAVLAHRPAAARLAAGRRRRRLRPLRRGLPRLRDARRRQDHLRAARRPPDALRGARVARRRRRADDPHLPPVGAGRRPLRHPPRAQPAELRRARAARPPRRRRHLRDRRGRRRRPPPPLRRAADAADRRRAAPHGRGRDVGAHDGRGVRAGALPAAALGHAVPLGQLADPVGVATTRRASRGADYDYGYTQALVDGVCRPVTFHTYGGDMEWVSDGRVRRADFDVVLPAAGGRAAAAHRAGPGRRLDHPRAARRRRGAARASAPATTPRRAGWSSRSTRSTPRSSPTGWRGSPASGRTSCTPTRRTRRRGSPASRPGSAPWLVSVLMVSEGVDVPRLRVGVYATTARTELFFRQVIGRFIRRTPAPKEQMSHVFLPSDPRLKQLAVEIEEERNHALVLEPAGRAGRRARRARRGRRGRSARCGRAPAATTRCCRRRSPATRCSSSPSRRRRRLAGAGGVHDHAGGRGGAAVEPETAFERRERLRAERQRAGRRRSPAAPARSTASINARINREVGAASVNKSTDEQLERANRLLEQAERRTAAAGAR